MNAQVPAPVRPQIHAGGAVAALVPQTLDEAFRVAQAIAVSGMAPRGLEKAEQCMVAIMAGSELGFAPFQSIQSFAIVNNRPTIWGDAIPALLWSHGFTLDEWFDNDDEPTKAFCKVTRPSGKEIERSFSLADAKLAGLLSKTGPWQTARKRMLQMRARAFAARDGASDVLRGLPVYEEVSDFQEFGRDVTPKTTGMKERLQSRIAAADGFNADHVARETSGQVEPAKHDADGVIDEPVIEAEFVDEADETFPGDRPSATTETLTLAQGDQARVTEQPKATIAERVAAFRKRMGEATNPLKLKSVRKAADNLFDDMELSDPEGRVELAFDYEERLAVLEEAARAEAAKGGAQ